MGIRVILTGATGMVGEGVLLTCLADSRVEHVLCLARRPIGRTHPKLTEYIVKDFLSLQNDDQVLRGYDACFFCAGVTSIGKKEPEYTHATYDTTLHVAKALLHLNPQMTFIYVSGKGTDSSEKGRLMWARVKGRTENHLAALPFKKVYNFRPGFMKAVPGQQHLLPAYKYFAWLYPVFKLFTSGYASTLHQVGQAMINSVITGSDKQVLEVRDINRLGGNEA